LIGSTINARYRIIDEVGKGGMGMVYRATDETLRRDVALKLLSKTQMDSEGRARLLREAQTLANLRHSNIVVVHDAGEHEEAPYIIMELIEGKTLQEHKPDNLEDVLAVVKQICTALQHAHEHNIIHRDLKPENVILDAGGTAKLMDFGLARSVSSRLTEEGTILGTVFYMAPEQVMGDEIDQRADLYALGVMLYELTTGELPFQDDNPVAIITQHIHAPPVPPIGKNGKIPIHLNKLILKLLEKDPEERPGSVSEVLQMLDSPQKGAESLRDSQDLSVLDRIVRGRMIGRKKEFEEARTIWGKAASGQGQTLLISGEPGIGKTRLTREIMTHVEVSGGQVLLGGSYAEGGAPYAPFGQIVRKMLGSEGDHTVELPEYILADLITIAPDLQPLHPDVSPNPKLELKFEQQRMFESVTIFFKLLSEKAAIVLVLEDVHWADSGTLFLMRHLTRHINELPILLVPTYREVEVDENLPFHDVLLDLNREGLTNRIKLRRLTKEKTRDLLATILAEGITPEFLDGIYNETDGNPFFIEEVCKALIESGKLYFENGQWHRPSIEELEIPQSIKMAIQSRVGKLSDPHQETLRIAAIIGHEFGFNILAAASHQDKDAIIDALESAEKAQLISDISQTGVVRYTFAHALIPYTLSEGVNILRRQRMHKRVAEAMEILYFNDFETLAHHFASAGDLEKSIGYYRQAAQRAEAMFSYDVAIQHLSTILDFLELDEHPELRFEVLEKLADVHHTFGQDVEAINIYHDVINEQGAGSDGGQNNRLRIYRKIIEIAVLMTFLEDFNKIETQYQNSIKAGLNLIKDRKPDQENVNFNIALSKNAWLRKMPIDWAEAEQFGNAAVEIAAELDDPELTSAALGALANAYTYQGKVEESLKISRRRLELSKQHDFQDQEEKIKILYDYGVDLTQLGDYDEALSTLEEVESLAEKGQNIFYQVWSILRQGRCFFELDRWDEILEIETKWRDLSQKYPNFFQRAGALCFEIALAASVHTYRGNFEQGAILREESYSIMTAHDGPPEQWDRTNHH
jgi:tetratricopeptide (TPR) repeat protein